MKIVREKLFENPDNIYIDDKKYNWREKTAIPFAVKIDLDDNIKDVKIGESGTMHGTMSGSNSEYYVYPGRVFSEPKVISFWAYPNEEEFLKIIKILENKLNLEILNNNWQIEIHTDKNGNIPNKGKKEYWENYEKDVVSSEFIPIEEYIGSKNTPKQEYTEHLKSPMLKKPNNSLAAKYSEISKKKKPLPWRQAMYAESVNMNFKQCQKD